MTVTHRIPELRKYSTLTREDIDHWMKYGYVVIRKAFTPEKAAEWKKDLWARLGYDPNDKETWTVDRVNMPAHNWQPCQTFAPKAWAAITELCGNEKRLSAKGAMFGDNFICNFGRDDYVGQDIDPRTFDNWHVDGDWFKHYLDSPEQSLLIIPLYSDIKPGGGGTMICPAGIPVIAQHLYNHPEGVSPRMVPTGKKSQHEDLGWFIEKVKSFKRSDFYEMTGEIGDVVLMHPLMLHSASPNTLRNPRIITNPSTSMLEPFNFNRENPADYSLIELKTLSALGLIKADYKITGKRELLNPTRVKMHERMKEQESLRLQGKLTTGNIEIGYDINRLESEVVPVA